ncbi:MAG: septum formation protein [Planctomycetota bacterium]
MSARLILGSASPRRQSLLAQAGLAFDVEPAHVDEDLVGLAPDGSSWEARPDLAAQSLAERKARCVAERHAGADSWVIGSDTVVAAGGRLLGKPEHEAEAAEMLRILVQGRHQVVTGVCVVRCSDGALESAWERTWVSMQPLDEPAVQAYVATGEWRGKAGGYAIQETADSFVTSLEEGGFDNVVGLPVALTLSLLERLAGPQPGK